MEKKKSHPVVGMINQRLLDAREAEGLTIAQWRKRLQVGDFTVSPSAIANYEEPAATAKNPARVPPLIYVAQVAVVFGFRLEWLLFGEEPIREDSVTEEEAEDLNYIKGLYGEETRSVLGRVAWLVDLDARLAFLKLLQECKRAAGQKGRDEGLPSLLGALYSLPFEVPGAKEWIVNPGDLSRREKSLVLQQLASLVHLLFLPFREEHDSFRWAQTLKKDE